ncbi:MAG: FimV/HubP family polar landmark protein [Pseudomonadota bacterium]
MLVVAVSASAAVPAWPLGLGDIKLNSALNEKLDAEIELHGDPGLQAAEVMVSLASAAEFERVGVERLHFLTDLDFEVDVSGDEMGAIHVSSSQPVTEPYLNFVVKVHWPDGRLLKEYTLLLDPPTFSPASAPSVDAPERSPSSETSAGQVSREAAADRGTRVSMPEGSGPGQPSPLDDGVVEGEYRMTDRSDTLWSIAERTRPSGDVSVNQYMLAIQRRNPDAFLHGNVNLVKAGYSLELPSAAEAREVSRADARREVALQTEDWRALQRGEEPSSRRSEQVAGTDEPELQSPMDATPESEPATAEPASDGGELKIVASAGDGVTGGNVPEAELDAALEEQDRLAREVDELAETLEREQALAADQLAVKDRQLEVKDQQIAELQSEVERLREEMEQLRAQAPAQSGEAAEPKAWWESSYVLGGAAGAAVLVLAGGLMAVRRRRVTESEDYAAAAEAPLDPEQGAAPGISPTFTEAEEEPEAASTGEPEVLAGADEVDDVGESETTDVIGEADIYIAYGRYPRAISLLLGVLEQEPDRNDVRLKLLELYAETRDRAGFDSHLAELVERCDDEEALLAARELAQQFGDGADADDQPEGRDVPETGGETDATLALGLDDRTEPGPEQSGDATDLALGLEDALEATDAPANGAAETFAPGPEGGGAADGDFELDLDDLILDEEDTARNGEATEPAAGGLETAADTALETQLNTELEIEPESEATVAESPAAEAPPAPDEVGETAAAGAGEDDLDLDLDLDLDFDLDDSQALGDDAFDIGEEGDTASTKLDLARAYIDMGDQDGARDILDEVVAEGNAEQQQRAQAMLEEL